MAQLLAEFLLPRIWQRTERRYTRNEVRQNCTSKDCWLIIDKQVYDVSSYLEEHPGGQFVILELAGRDATSAFRGKGHSTTACKILEKFKIGRLQERSETLP